MKPEEALRTLDIIYTDTSMEYVMSKEFEDAIRVAQQALSKQVSMELEPDNLTDEFYYCPECGSIVGTKAEYCKKCGQKVHRGEEDGN